MHALDHVTYVVVDYCLESQQRTHVHNIFMFTTKGINSRWSELSDPCHKMMKM